MAEKTGKGLRDAAGLVLLTGACACTGAVIGAAGHFYNTYMTPGRPVPRRGGKKFEKEFAEGSSWIKTTLSAKMYIFALMTVCRCTAAISLRNL